MLRMPGQINEQMNLKCDFHREMKLNKDTFMKLFFFFSLISSQFSQGIKMHPL